MALEIRPTAIYHWIRAASAPRPVLAAMIQKLARESGVNLTFDQIYQHSRDLRAGGLASGVKLTFDQVKHSRDLRAGSLASGAPSCRDNGIRENRFAARSSAK